MLESGPFSVLRGRMNSSGDSPIVDYMTLETGSVVIYKKPGGRFTFLYPIIPCVVRSCPEEVTTLEEARVYVRKYLAGRVDPELK